MSRNSSSSVSPSLGIITRHHSTPVWLIVGASRGIGLEFVRQLLARGHRVYAAIRDPANASQLWTLAGSAPMANCELLQCDIAYEENIVKFAMELASRRRLDRIDYVVMNAGIMRYPNRASELSYDLFADHLRTNTIGPIITAQNSWTPKFPSGLWYSCPATLALLQTFATLKTDARFAAYAASKAALNQMLRHLAAELQRKKIMTTVLAMHPGEVATDMSNVSVGWDIEGVITPEQSVAGMLPVIESKDMRHTGTFWTWEGKPHPW